MKNTLKEYLIVFEALMLFLPVLVVLAVWNFLKVKENGNKPAVKRH